MSLSTSHHWSLKGIYRRNMNPLISEWHQIEAGWTMTIDVTWPQMTNDLCNTDLALSGCWKTSNFFCLVGPIIIIISPLVGKHLNIHLSLGFIYWNPMIIIFVLVGRWKLLVSATFKSVLRTRFESLRILHTVMNDTQVIMQR